MTITCPGCETYLDITALDVDGILENGEYGSRTCELCGFEIEYKITYIDPRKE